MIVGGLSGRPADTVARFVKRVSRSEFRTGKPLTQGYLVGTRFRGPDPQRAPRDSVTSGVSNGDDQGKPLESPDPIAINTGAASG